MTAGVAVAQEKDITVLLSHYEADKGSLMRFYRIDNSPERTDRLKTFNSDFLQQLNAFNFDTLTVAERVA